MNKSIIQFELNYNNNKQIWNYCKKWNSDSSTENPCCYQLPPKNKYGETLKDYILGRHIGINSGWLYIDGKSGHQSLFYGVKIKKRKI